MVRSPDRTTCLTEGLQQRGATFGRQWAGSETLAERGPGMVQRCLGEVQEAGLTPSPGPCMIGFRWRVKVSRQAQFVDLFPPLSDAVAWKEEDRAHGIDDVPGMRRDP